MIAASITGYEWPRSRKYRAAFAGMVAAVSAPLVHHGPGTALAASAGGAGMLWKRGGAAGSSPQLSLPAAAATRGPGCHNRHGTGWATQPVKGSFPGIAADFVEPWEVGAREGSFAPAPRFSWKPRCSLLSPSSLCLRSHLLSHAPFECLLPPYFL